MVLIEIKRSKQNKKAITTRPRVMRLDQVDQSLFSVLDGGEGHLLHQASRRLRSDILQDMKVFFSVSLTEHAAGNSGQQCGDENEVEKLAHDNWIQTMSRVCKQA
ncbi:hypothetical protein GIV20_19845 [Pseudomonas tremae]|nr:hypothetical protein [Pseudomonas tremae]MCF5810318.1 hypothetical protein [Pseudomonas tremae]